ncbi:MFS transporter [Dictyobacter alpinus]|nr:MFS transporter [Dictyobacter alpinus]
MKQDIIKDQHRSGPPTVSPHTHSLEKRPAVTKPLGSPDYLSIGSNLFSTLLLRIASRTSFLLLGFYLGEHFASATVVVLVLESFYISELLLAPLAGSLSDRIGRKPFLFLAPILGALAALLLLLGASLYPRPDANHVDIHLLFLLLLILCGRLLEGATTALNTPASLGYITDITIGSDRLRARVMTAFEVATVGGLALAIPFGGQVAKWMGNWGFFVVIGLHVANLLVVTFLVKESHHRSHETAESHGSLVESLKMLRDKHIFTFLPAWLSVNTLVGAWITLIVIMLTYPNPAADLRHPHQLLYGGFGKDLATMLLGGFGLFFLIGMGFWMLILPRLRRTTIMSIGLIGLGVCIASLTAINGLGENIASLSTSAHTTLWLLLPAVLLGVLLLSGFTPASLTHMAAISERKVGKRGAVMGLYSVVLGIGQLVGASVGGMAVDLGGFNGLMGFSVVLGILSMISVLYMRRHKHDLLQ